MHTSSVRRSTSAPWTSPTWPRRLAASIAVAVAVLAWSPLQGAGAQDAGGSAAADHGAAWIATQVAAGLPLQNFGSGDWGVTLDAGLAFAASGTGAAQTEQIWAAVLAAREDVVAPFGGDSPGRLAKLILLARALGEDPRAVGAEPGADLVARLGVLAQPGGPDAGLFGTADPTYDGAYRQGIALVALIAAGAAVDPSSVAWLEAQQCADGSWMPYRADLDEPCAFDPVSFVGPDSNSVALAVAGLLAASPGSSSLEPARDWLEANQNDDGGWSFFPGDGSDPNSTALVMQALIDDGSLDSPRFTSGDRSPLASLLSFQLDCSAAAEDRGAFTFPFSNDAPSLLSTTQAVPAAAGVGFDHVASSIAEGVTPLDCEPATTTTTVPTTEAPTTAAPTTAAPTDTSAPAAAPIAPVAAPAPVAAGAVAGTSGGTPATALALTGRGTVWLGALGAALAIAGALMVLGARRERR